MKWTVTALTTATAIWGPLPLPAQVVEQRLPGPVTAQAVYPRTIVLDTHPRPRWTRNRVLCAVVHEYGHLKGRGHSRNPRSIMWPSLEGCDAWVRRRGR